MIQMLTFSGAEEKYRGKGIEVNKIHDAKSLDDFEINIVNLNDARMWRCDSSKYDRINSNADFQSLSEMISDCKTTKIVILFPQNIDYCYFYTDNRYYYSEELKDIINIMQSNIATISNEVGCIDIVYENTESQIMLEKIKAAFLKNFFQKIKMIRQKMNRAQKRRKTISGFP